MNFLNQNPGVWAFCAAVFAGLAALCAAITLINNYKIRQKDKAPDLYLKKDKFVYGKYEFFTQRNGVPKGIPDTTALLSRQEIVRDGVRLNRICIVYNTSRKHTNNETPECYSRIFGEVYFENRGGSTIKSIEIIECRFIMRRNTGLELTNEIALQTQGCVSVNIQKGQRLIVYIAYLFDKDDHMLCNPFCLDENGQLKQNIMELKHNEEDQLRCPLPVIIDLYERMIFTFRYTTAPDNHIYEQTFLIEIQPDSDFIEDGEYPSGIYNPIDRSALRVKK